MSSCIIVGTENDMVVYVSVFFSLLSVVPSLLAVWADIVFASYMYRLLSYIPHKENNGGQN